MFKLMLAKNRDPIIVEVSNGRWDAYATHPVPTDDDRFLLKYIERQGGINESVPDGRYHFNLVRVGFFKFEVTLNSTE